MYYEKIVLPGGLAEKEYWEKYFKSLMSERNRLCVIYNPDCGCSVDQFVVLDRYPMTKKIISRCSACNKDCLMKISNPIIFHCPLMDEDYSLQELKELYVAETEQKELIEKYKKI